MIVESFLVLTGTVLVYLLPGFVWSFVFLERKTDSLDSPQAWLFNIIERLAVSIVLSLVLIPLTVFLLNLVIDIGSSLENSLLISLLPTCIGLLILILERKNVLRTIWNKIGLGGDENVE